MRCVFPKLCDRCDTLEETIRQLRTELRLSLVKDDVSALRVAYDLTPAEAQLLLLLYKAKGKAVTYARLLHETSRQDTGPQAIKVRIRAVRRKFGAFILTVRNEGYRLNPAGEALVREAITVREAA